MRPLRLSQRKKTIVAKSGDEMMFLSPLLPVQ